MTATTDHGASQAVSVNGEATQVHATRIEELLRELGHDPQQGGIAIAINDEVIPRSEWEQITVQTGDSIEIVAATQGG